MTDAAGSCRSDSSPLVSDQLDRSSLGVLFLGQGEKVSCRCLGLVEILAAPAVNAASHGEVKQLDPERAHLRPPGPRQLYKAEFPIRESSSSRSRSTSRGPARSRCGSSRAACVTATSGLGTTATGASRSRCLLWSRGCGHRRTGGGGRGPRATRRPGRPVLGGAVRRLPAVCPWCTATLLPRLDPGAPAPPDPRRRAARRRVVVRHTRHPNRRACRPGRPAPRRYPARSCMPARMRCLHRRWRRDPDREGLAGCDRRRDRSRRHRPVRDAGSQDRRRRPSDRDPHRGREARMGREVRGDRCRSMHRSSIRSRPSEN